MTELRTCRFYCIPMERLCPRSKRMIYRRFWLHTFLVADGDKGISTRIAADRNWRVIILFLDAAVPLEYGNLMTKTVSWDTLVSIYLSGRIAATLCGPPCERFSAARFKCRCSAAGLFGLEGLSLPGMCRFFAKNFTAWL